YKAPKGQVVLVEVPQMPFLAVDGLGDPNSEGFKQVVQALYSLSYAVKFRLRKSLGLEHKVGPLEGLWWVEGAEGMSFEELLSRRAGWSWTL
ncbi:GyrI-like domain-containing protein, partial [Escherichia coli]|nr:GyrI-like domain-containing protein [Escherichia coli]